MKLSNAILTIGAILVFAMPVRSQDNIEAVKKKIMEAYEVFNANDQARFGEFIDENITDHIPFSPDQRPGLAGIRDIFNIMYTAFPDMKQTVEEVVISPDGSKAAVLVRSTGTNKGEFMGMKPTNNQFDVLGCDILYFKNGKVTDHWGFIDNDSFMKQLGMK